MSTHVTNGMSTLQAARVRSGLTRRTVAIEIGMTEKQIQRWEKGLSPVKRVHLLALAAVYGVPVESLEEAA